MSFSTTNDYILFYRKLKYKNTFFQEFIEMILEIIMRILHKYKNKLHAEIYR